MGINWIQIYKKYRGKWIALKDDEKTVIASGKSAKIVFKKATRIGIQNPILSFVPIKLMTRVGYNS